MDNIVKNENHIVIQGWMVNELGLKGNDLLVYAIIYGFSQLEEQTFNGSLRYLATWTQSTKQGVMINLKNLLDKGYIGKIEKTKNGVKFVEYYTTKFNRVCNSVEQGMQLSLPNNIEDNIKEKSIINNTLKESGKKTFVKPTLEEVLEYCKERNKGVDGEQWYDFYTSKGWLIGKTPMKDWKAAIRTWERSKNNKQETKKQAPTLPEFVY